MIADSLDDELSTPRPSRERRTVFVLTWLAYAAYYFGRKSFGVVKSTLQDGLGLSVAALGWIDTGYLTAYAVGQFASGALGDRSGARRLVGVGMLGVAVACAGFGMTSTAAAFFLAYLMNGLFQSTGWPGTVKAMGAWFTPRERGAVMGLWSTCYQIGGLAATAVATFLFVHFGWRWSFIGPAGLIALVGMMVLLLLPERQSPALAAAASPDARPDSNRLAFSPVLWSLGSSYFCIKLIRYSILFWLPYYLNKVLGYTKEQAGYQSISFEIGGFIGSVVIGYLSDRFFPGRRRIVAAVGSALLAGAVLLYMRVAPVSLVMNFGAMTLVGFCLFGPDTLIAGAAAQDLGGKHNIAKAAGFINGLGSIGAVFQGPVTTNVSQKFGWSMLFYVYALLAVVACIALLLGKRHASEDRASIDC